MRLLIVDDHELNRKLLRLYLSSSGFTLLEAADGQQALSIIDLEPVDLVITDLLMPDLDGYQLCQELRNREQSRNIPIILYTDGNSEARDLERARQAGASRFVRKPVSMVVLEQLIAELLDVRPSRPSEELAPSSPNSADYGDWLVRKFEAQTLEYMRLQSAILLTNQELVRHTEALDRSETHLTRLLDNIQDVYFKADVSGVIELISPSVKRYGYLASELRGRNLATLTGDLEACELLERLERGDVIDRLETQIRCADGSTAWCLASWRVNRTKAGELTGITGVCHDITERKRFEEVLRHSTFHDPLTGLPNRSLLRERLERAHARAIRRPDQRYSVLLLDLDRFKDINESLGQRAGDRLILEVSRRLQHCIRPGDTVARIGGDEFAFLLDGVSEVPLLLQVATRILAAFREPFQLGAHRLQVAASIGLATSAISCDGPDEPLRHAEMAMYRAKLLGGARLSLFEPRHHARGRGTLLLEEELGRALERDELALHFQPIISAREGALVGAEALLRWKHPVRGMVPPAEFIPIAERSDLILAIGEWVIRAACIQNSLWRQEGLPEIRIAVNCSGRQFQDPGLPALVRRLLSATQLDASGLELEITESVAMHDVEFSIATFKELRDMGLKLSIDDFGTGYSSLSYLKRFPIDALKVDQSFVRGIPLDEGDKAIASVVIGLGRTLGLKVLAEGVETVEQHEFLTRAGCDLFQGYHFSLPVPARHFTEMLREGLTFGGAHRVREVIPLPKKGRTGVVLPFNGSPR